MPLPQLPLRIAPVVLASTLLVLIPQLTWGQQAKPQVKKPAATTAPSVAAPAPPAVVDVQIQGQVFIVTRGGSNIKLALIALAAFSEEDLLAQFTRTAEAERAMRISAGAELQKAKDELAAAEQDSAALRARSRSNLDQRLAARARGDFAAQRAGDAEYVEIMRLEFSDAKKLAAAKAAVQDSSHSLAELLSPRHFITKLAGARATTKSDADGNFAITVPPGPHVLVATGKRLVGERTEMYEWMVRVDATKPGQRIMLSNDNMVDSGCAECVPMPTLTR